MDSEQLDLLSFSFLHKSLKLKKRLKRLICQIPDLTSNIGIGRGKAKRRRIQTFGGKDFYSELKRNPILFKQRVRMTPQQFDFLYEEMAPYIEEPWNQESKVRSLDCRNRVLLILSWIFHYEKYHNLQCLFNISSFQVSTVINQGMAWLVHFFLMYLEPFPFTPQNVSELSTMIVGVVDGTITPILRPAGRQHWYYRGDKGTHFLTTMLVVDEKHYIHWICAGSPGCLHDSSIIRFSDIGSVINDKYLLGDPGFQGLDECVAGFKISTVNFFDAAQAEFDSISRREQVVVENVNSMIKKSTMLSKRSYCRHCKHTLVVASTLVVCGLHNFKLHHFSDNEDFLYCPPEIQEPNEESAHERTEDEGSEDADDEDEDDEDEDEDDEENENEDEDENVPLDLAHD